MSAKKELTTSLKDQTLTTVENRILELREGGFKLPKNYSVENALQSAWIMLQDVKTRDKQFALKVCSRNSIAMSLFKMVQLGLNPAKNQGYFIPYGSQLVFMTSYFGNVLIGKRAGLKDVKANLILEKDEFNYKIESDGSKIITEHNQPFTNLGNKIIGAYCVVTFQDGTQDTDIMTIGQIKQSWQQGATKGNSPAHQNFEGEMAKRTVTNRAIKMFVNSSDDGAIMDDVTEETPTESFVSHKIETEANKGKEIDFEEEEADEPKDYYDVEEVEYEEEVEEVEKPQPKPKAKPQPKTMPMPEPKAEPKQAKEPQQTKVDWPDW